MREQAKNVIRQFMLEKKPFTRFCVYKQLKHLTYSSYSDVKDAIRELIETNRNFLDGIYSFAMVTVPHMDNTKTRVYYNYFGKYNPDEFFMIMNKPFLFNGPSASFTKKYNKTKTVKSPPKIVKRVKTNLDSRGRVCVPTSITRELGLKPGDKSYVFSDNNVVLIRQKMPKNHTFKAIKVDNHGNIRFTHDDIKSKKPEVSINNGSIIVR